MIKRPLIWILGGWILGEIVAGWLGVSVSPPTTLDQAMTGRDSLEATVTGTVCGVQKTDSGIRLRITDNEVLWEDQLLDTHDLLLWKGGGGSAAFSLLSAEPGNRIRVTGLLKPFAVPANPGEFHSQQYYRIQGIDYQLEPYSLEVVEEGSFGLQRWSENLREQLHRSIEAVTSDGESRSLFLALVLGDRGELSEETRTLYQTGGLMHLLAISALHLSLLGMFLWKGLIRIGIPRVMAGGGAAAFLLWYVWFTGGSASGRRAFLMFVVMLGATLLGRTYDLLSALGLAGILLLWEQPLYAWQSGFQLSFAAMAGIGILYPAAVGWCGIDREKGPPVGTARIGRVGWRLRQGLRRALLFSLCVQLATLPVMAWHYFSISVYGVFLNLLAIPLMSYAMLSVFSASLLGVFAPAVGQLAAGGAELIFHFYRQLCLLVSALPRAQWITGQPSVGKILFWLALLALLTAGWDWEKRCRKKGQGRNKGRKKHFPQKGRVRIFLLFYLLGILWFSPLPRRELGISTLDVGQGDCTVVLLPGGGACLVDGGSSSVSQVGEKRILPYLKQEGVSRLEMIFLSHSDEDHTNGIGELLQDPALEICGLAIPAASAGDSAWQELLALARFRGIPVYPLQTGDGVQCGEVTFTCLSPAANAGTDDSNDLSLVLELGYAGFKGLFTGDISAAVEEQLRLPARITWLKVAHHGSRYSSGEDFLDTVRPQIAVISCGKGNLYGHPHEETLERLKACGVQLHQTSECGAIQMRIRENGIFGSCYRTGEQWMLPGT